jgi:hypothetical protein
LIDRLLHRTNGAFVYSHINFRFDTATFEGITGEVALGDRFDPRRPPLMSFPVGSIADEKYGAFQFQTNWECESTFDCRRVAGQRRPIRSPGIRRRFARGALALNGGTRTGRLKRISCSQTGVEQGRRKPALLVVVTFGPPVTRRVGRDSGDQDAQDFGEEIRKFSRN